MLVAEGITPWSMLQLCLQLAQRLLVWIRCWQLQLQDEPDNVAAEWNLISAATCRTIGFVLHHHFASAHTRPTPAMKPRHVTVVHQNLPHGHIQNSKHTYQHCACSKVAAPQNQPGTLRSQLLPLADGTADLHVRQRARSLQSCILGALPNMISTSLLLQWACETSLRQSVKNTTAWKLRAGSHLSYTYCAKSVCCLVGLPKGAERSAFGWLLDAEPSPAFPPGTAS
jgi:hypothetical protein